MKEKSSLKIRRALPSEAALLSALAFRSRAHWGYDAEFMERAGWEPEWPGKCRPAPFPEGCFP